jgi:hypothetical protein
MEMTFDGIVAGADSVALIQISKDAQSWHNL